MTSAPAALEWRLSEAPVAYDDALTAMEARAQAVRAGTASELVWLLEHPPLYTAGTSAAPGDLLHPDRFPVHRTGRGGRYTYHGPGQRVAYAVLDLDARGRDLRRYVWQLEEWVIRTLAAFGVRGLRRAGRVGIWVVGADGCEAKIAAIGVRVRRLGRLSRARHQRGARARAFQRHRALRHQRVRRHLLGGTGDRHDAGRGGRGLARAVRRRPGTAVLRPAGESGMSRLRGTGAAVLGLCLAMAAAAPALAECTDVAAPGVNWRRCLLDGQDLDGVSLEGADLRSASFKRASLEGAKLAGAEARGAKFVSAALVRVDLQRSSLIQADFTLADLTGASLKGADLRYARFYDANLRRADFSGAQLDEADFLRADLSGATWIDGKTICAEGSLGQCRAAPRRANEAKVDG